MKELNFNQNSSMIIALPNNASMVPNKEEDFYILSNQDPTKSVLFFTFLWPLISIVGILANLSVVIVLPTSKKRRATEYFCINLAISDMLFLVVCPTMLLANYHQIFNLDILPLFLSNIICKTDYFLTHLTVYITCLTLMSMTFDRFVAIIYPLRSLRIRSSSKAVLINVPIWILSALMSVPQAYFREFIVIQNETSFCGNSNTTEEGLDLGLFQMRVDQLQISFTILVAYIIPFTTIVFCYLLMIIKINRRKKDLENSNDYNFNKKRKRILVMIALVTILFGVTWLPIHCFLFAIKFFENFPFHNDTWFFVKNIAHTLTYLNSLLNPFFYTIMGQGFKIKFISRLSRYSSSHKSSLTKGNQINRGSLFVKRASLNEKNERLNSNAYKYKYINQR